MPTWCSLKPAGRGIESGNHLTLHVFAARAGLHFVREEIKFEDKAEMKKVITLIALSLLFVFSEAKLEDKLFSL